MKRTSTLLAFLVVAGGGVAFAQGIPASQPPAAQAPAAERPGPTQLAAASQASTSGSTASTTVIAGSSPGRAPAAWEAALSSNAVSMSEAPASARKMLEDMSGAADRLRKKLAAARQERDVVKVLCIGDKLDQVEVAVKSGTERRDTLDMAVSRKDADRVDYEHQVIKELHGHVEELEAQANQCIGEETSFVGPTELQVVIDPNMPASKVADYPTEYEPPLSPGLSPPPASPAQ